MTKRVRVTHDAFDKKILESIAKDPSFAAEYFEELSTRPLAAQLAVLRLLAGRTQGDLARGLGLEQTHVSRLEREGRRHRLDSYEKAAALLGARIALIPKGYKVVPAGASLAGASVVGEAAGSYRGGRRVRRDRSRRGR